MARIKIESKDVVSTHTLDELIPAYAENKAMLEDYKKLCSVENEEIKALMTEDTYETGGYKATKSVSSRDSLNEDRVLATVDDELRKYFNKNNIIKTKEYIDVDNLESLIYALNNKHDDESKRIKDNLISLLDKCTDRKEVVTLRISKVKKEKKNGENKES